MRGENRRPEQATVDLLASIGYICCGMTLTVGIWKSAGGFTEFGLTRRTNSEHGDNPLLYDGGGFVSYSNRTSIPAMGHIPPGVPKC